MSKKVPMIVGADGIPQVAIPITWDVPESLVTRYATHMLVQFIENEFKLLFFEMKPQLYLGGTPPTEAKAVCVASVIVSPKKMLKIIKALTEQVEKVKSAKLDGAESPEN